MKPIKFAVLLISLCAFCVVGGGHNYVVSPAFADGGTQTLTLELLSGGLLASEVTNNYILRIPSDFSVKQKGWNEIGSIDVSVSEDKVFNTEKQVVVTATSANEFKLKTSGGDEITYELKTAESDENATTEFTFAAEAINGGTASQDLGIYITWDNTQAAGTYTDTLTYTGEVQDAGTTSATVDLSKISGAYEAQNGDVLTGTLGSAGYKITVAAGATITLRSVDITSIPNDGDHNWAGITPLGNVTIILEGKNAVKGGYENYPGIFAAEDATLTIKGSGSLTASSNGYGTGIGGGQGFPCGNIVIEGGTIEALGGEEQAGIGSGGNESSCGTITISGGTVNATGGNLGAGIGSGMTGHCGDITISGGTIEATGGSGGAGIGSSESMLYDDPDMEDQLSSCGTITIKSTVISVTATKGSEDANSIGAGNNGTCDGVNIEPGANVTQK